MKLLLIVHVLAVFLISPMVIVRLVKKGLKATWQRVLLLVGGTALVISALAALAWIAS
mgnify:CR=1 FL=1